MDRSRPCGADTDTETAVFCKTRRNEGRDLFVAHGDIADAVLLFTQSFDNGINSITDDTEDMGRAPIN
jgi:hypothetical protein